MRKDNADIHTVLREQLRTNQPEVAESCCVLPEQQLYSHLGSLTGYSGWSQIQASYFSSPVFMTLFNV